MLNVLRVAVPILASASLVVADSITARGTTSIAVPWAERTTSPAAYPSAKFAGGSPPKGATFTTTDITTVPYESTPPTYIMVVESQTADGTGVTFLRPSSLPPPKTSTKTEVSTTTETSTSTTTSTATSTKTEVSTTTETSTTTQVSTSTKTDTKTETSTSTQTSTKTETSTTTQVSTTTQTATKTETSTTTSTTTIYTTPKPACTPGIIKPWYRVDVLVNTPTTLSGLSFSNAVSISVLDAGYRSESYRLEVDGSILGITSDFEPNAEDSMHCGWEGYDTQKCLDRKFSTGTWVLPANSRDIKLYTQKTTRNTGRADQSSAALIRVTTTCD